MHMHTHIDIHIYICIYIYIYIYGLKKNTHNLLKITNISLLFRSFIIDKASEKKRNICDFK